MAGKYLDVAEEMKKNAEEIVNGTIFPLDKKRDEAENNETMEKLKNEILVSYEIVGNLVDAMYDVYENVCGAGDKDE